MTEPALKRQRTSRDQLDQLTFLLPSLPLPLPPLSSRVFLGQLPDELVRVILTWLGWDLRQTAARLLKINFATQKNFSAWPSSLDDKGFSVPLHIPLHHLKFASLGHANNLRGINRNLEHLEIDNQVHLPPLVDLPNLHTLKVSNCLRVPELNLSHLRSLRKLSIVRTPVGNWPDAPELRDLVVVREVNGTAIPFFPKLQSLKIQQVSRPMLFPAGLPAGLQRLDCDFRVRAKLPPSLISLNWRFPTATA